jgi:uncharacterized alpha-E superfamily protein
VLCRVAENLFWMGRYVERAVATARLIDVTAHLELDAAEARASTPDFWTPLLGMGDVELPPSGTAESVRQYLAISADNPNSLVSCIHHARLAARSIRESITSEMWEHLNRLYLAMLDSKPADAMAENPHAFFKRVLDGLLLFQGLADATLARDEAWQFISLGQYLERADNVARALSAQAYLLVNPAAQRHEDDLVRWLAVLRSCGSAEAYARYYTLRVDPPRVLEFLLLNAIFPQSVRFSLNAGQRAIEAIVAGWHSVPDAPSPAARELGLLRSRVEYAGVDEILEEGLDAYLAEIQQRIAVTSDALAATFFRTQADADRQMPVARAAALMAAQQ